jgi:hypothetical protein
MLDPDLFFLIFEQVSKETWASWTSIVGWPVAGVYGGCGGGSIVTAVDSKAEYGGIGRLRIIPGDKDGINMCAVGDSDGCVRLMRFPALVGGRDHRDREAASKVTGHGTEALRVYNPEPFFMLNTFLSPAAPALSILESF